MFVAVRLGDLLRLGLLALLVAALSRLGGKWAAQPATTTPGRTILRYVEGYGQGPPISARAAVLMEAETGTVLFAHREHERRGPASTTKIMTAILALERGDLRERVTIGRRPAWTEGSTIGLRQGQVLTLRQLLYGLMMESGNDAAIAIAEHLAGSVERFVQQMNLRAQQLGCWNTSFADPHGLSRTWEGHYTTALDLALLTRRALAIPEFARVVRSRVKTVEEGDLPAWRFANTNRLLWSFGGADGVKTGTTSEAGYCLVASANRDGFRLIAVVLDSADRWRDAAALLEYGYREFQPALLAVPGQPVGQAPVRWGMRRSVPVVPAGPVMAVVRRAEQGHLVAELQARPLLAPVRPGDAAGRLIVRQGGEEITSAEVRAALAVPRRTLWRMVAAALWTLWRLAAAEAPPVR
ncbi:MAG: D-alanyl-D-alanine carboxypeptidase family protein [Bacillota bacterium]|nr:D-alanyl-D-alanine carboxypeptidase family protein [Bacillota bacterium]